MRHKWTIVITIIVLAIIALFIFSRVGSDPTIAENGLFNIDFDEQVGIEVKGNSQSAAAAAASGDPDGETVNVGESGETKKASTLLNYTNSQYNFSFSYPAGVTVGSFKEGVGEMVLIQSEDTSKSAQIFIIPFDEPAPISKARILKDLPDMVIKDDQNGTVGGHPAIAFLGKHETLGSTYEIWFTRDEHLYQIMTKESTASFLINIIKTWTE
jgi:hypothetical protein